MFRISHTSIYNVKEYIIDLWKIIILSYLRIITATILERSDNERPALMIRQLYRFQWKIEVASNSGTIISKIILLL